VKTGFLKNEQGNSTHKPTKSMAKQLYHGLKPDALIAIETAANLAVWLLDEIFLPRRISLDSLLKHLLCHRVSLSSALPTVSYEYVKTVAGLTCFVSNNSLFH
jgi:hypothetical protein